jgi:hypothetical protein
VNDIAELNLPQAWESRIKAIIHRNRMLWEPWIETVETYEKLKESMKRRGYTNLPTYSMPAVTEIEASNEVKNTRKLSPPKTMIRKGKKNAK